MLATVHLVWGDAKDLAKRAEEASLLAKMLRDTVAPGGSPLDDFSANLIALGDFNATAADDPIVAALATAGMVTATEIAGARRTTSDVPAGRRRRESHRATRSPTTSSPSSIRRCAGGRARPRSRCRASAARSFAWDDFILKSATELWAQAEKARRERKPRPAGAYDPTFSLSDHYPLWLELSVRPPDDVP